MHDVIEQINSRTGGRTAHSLPPQILESMTYRTGRVFKNKDFFNKGGLILTEDQILERIAVKRSSRKSAFQRVVPVMQPKEHVSAWASTKLSKYAQPLTPDWVKLNSSTLKDRINENELLILLEKQPLTIENISESLDISISRISQVVRKLFDEGYIDKVDSGILQKIFPFIVERAKRKASLIDLNTHLTLTLKGYFKIHPFLVIHKQRGSFI